jgi:citronellol/citronellal dehydrogenase
MSMCTLGMAEEFRGKVAVNALWPRTPIATAAVDMLGGEDMTKRSRKPEIMGDAAYFVFARPFTECTGNFFIDDEVLRTEGIVGLDEYAVDPRQELLPDFFLD